MDSKTEISEFLAFHRARITPAEAGLPMHGTSRRAGDIVAMLRDVLDGTIEPGKMFDLTVGLDQVADGYRAMDGRTALKVIVQP